MLGITAEMQVLWNYKEKSWIIDMELDFLSEEKQQNTSTKQINYSSLPSWWGSFKSFKQVKKKKEKRK